MKDNSNTETLQICRTCMKELINKSLFFNLHFIDENTELTIRQKLYDCIPELNLTIVPNAVICYECADIVNSLYKFKKGCFQTEVKIHKYIQHIQQTDNVTDLVDVAQFHRQPYENLRTELKTEAFEVIENFKIENFKIDESTVCDGNTCNEAVIHTNYAEREYLLSPQKVELEDVLFSTDDNFITYSTSKSKEISDTFDENIAQNNIPQAVDKQDDYIQNVDTPDSIYECYTCGHKTESKLKLIVHIKRHTTKNQQHGTAPKSVLKNYESIKLEPTQNLAIKNNKVKWRNPSYSKRNSKIQSKRMCQNSDSRIGFGQDTSSKSNVENLMLKELFKCSVCKYQCTQKNHLKEHMRIHTGEKPFKCSVCEYRCTTGSNLKVHMRIHTGEKPFKCSICEYQCSQKLSLKVHMRIHTGEKPFKCAVCEYQCKIKCALKRHLQIHTGERPFKCLVCEHQFGEKRSLDIHMQTHTGVKPFKCSICEYQFSRKINLKTHLQIHTGEKPYKCSVCEYQCIQKSGLKIHMRIHTGEKSFKCSICKFQCNQKNNLKRHMILHTGEKLLKCSICEYQCNQKNQLKRHMILHTGEKPFKCSVCEYQFTSKSNLKVHMRIHTGEKPFKCSVCEYHCTIKSSLKVHMRIHTGEKPFKCSVCEFQCVTKSNLKVHMRTHTG